MAENPARCSLSLLLSCHSSLSSSSPARSSRTILSLVARAFPVPLSLDSVLIFHRRQKRYRPPISEKGLHLRPPKNPPPTLPLFASAKELEIEDLCQAHYQNFILVVDDLQSLLSDVDSLKSSLSYSNSLLQSIASPLLTSLDAFIKAYSIARNAFLPIDIVRCCICIVDLRAHTNSHLVNGHFYLALKLVDTIEHDMEKTPSTTLRRMLECQIPAIQQHVKLQTNKEFGDWLVQIYVMSQKSRPTDNRAGIISVTPGGGFMHKTAPSRGAKLAQPARLRLHATCRGGGRQRRRCGFGCKRRLGEIRADGIRS